MCCWQDAVLAHEHEAKTKYRLAPAVGSHSPEANFATGLHVGHIADANGHAILGGDDDVLDLFHVHRPALAVDQ